MDSIAWLLAGRQRQRPPNETSFDAPIKYQLRGRRKGLPQIDAPPLLVYDI
jgi:hypothetical protein